MSKRRVRRQFSADFKRQVVAETYAAGTSVSVVARRHDINANLLFRWRDDPRYGSEAHSFLPVAIDDGSVDHPPIALELGIWIAHDVRLVVKGPFDPAAVGTLIRSIRTGS